MRRRWRVERLAKQVEPTSRLASSPWLRSASDAPRRREPLTCGRLRRLRVEEVRRGVPRRVVWWSRRSDSNGRPAHYEIAMTLRKISRLRSRAGRSRRTAAHATAPAGPDGTQTAPTGWLAERSESSRVTSHGCHVAPDEFPGPHTRSLNRGLGNLKGDTGKEAAFWLHVRV